MELYDKRTALVSPLDIQVFFMNIPALKEADREEIIRSQLRTLYPGDPGNTVFDYILCRGKGRGKPRASGGRSIVWAAEKETYDLYRETGKALIPGLSILCLGAEKIRAQAKLVILLTPEWVEAARFEDNEISRYVSAYRDQGAAEIPPVSSLYTEEERDVLPVLIIEHPEAHHSGPGRPFKNCLSMGIGEVSKGVNIKKRRIFYRSGEGQRINHRLIISALIILNGASLVISLRLVSSRMAEEGARLQNIHREQMAYKKEAEKLKKEIAEMEGRLSNSTDQGHTIYEIISEIDACLSKARIQNLIIQQGTFNLEAEGEDSIGVFRALEGSHYFSDISLHQAAPSKTGGEQFSISGKVNHE
jgi:cell division protein FtsB